MADTARTLSDLNILFQTLTMQMFGLSMVVGPALDASAYKVRLAWPKGGAPAWKVDDDVAFLRCMEVDDPYNRQREVVNSAIDVTTYNQATGYTVVNSIFWMIYGPNSYANAQTIRDKMFYQDYHDILARSNIFLNSNVKSPQRSPEFFEGQWWERVDLTMHFNELVIRNITGNVITSAEINLQGERGSPIIKTIQ